MKQHLTLLIEWDAYAYWGKLPFDGTIITASADNEEEVVATIKDKLFLDHGLGDDEYVIDVRYV
jgi:hypothetical protein